MSRTASMALVILGICGWTLAQSQHTEPIKEKDGPTPKKEPAQRKSQYQITPVANSAILLDTANGEQWQLLRIPGTDRFVWVTLKEPLRGDDAKKQKETFDKISELSGPGEGPPGRFQYITNNTGEKLFDTATGRLYIRVKKGAGEYDVWSMQIKSAK